MSPAKMLEIIRTERQKREAQSSFDRELEHTGASLSSFTKAAWHVLEPGQPYKHGWHLDALSEHLEAVTAGEILRLLINIPPGTMKSLSVGVMWPAWEWGPKGLPHMRYLGTSHSLPLGIRDNLKMRRLVTSEWYRERWGRQVELTSDQNAKTKFENTATGFREAMAFTGLTGSRGDRVLIDDPLSVDNANSDAERENVNSTFRESVPTRLNNPDRSAIVVVMQRLHEDDVSGLILANDFGYEHLMLPMEFEPERRCYTSIGFVDPRKQEGELLFPERFPREVVERDKKVMDAYAVAGQFQQRPAPREGGLFKAAWLKPCYLKDIPTRDTLSVYGGSDYAVTANGGDYTVHGAIGLDAQGRMWLLDVWRKQAASDQWIEAFCDMVLHWKPNGWAEETGQIKSGVGPFRDRRMRERKAYVVCEAFPTRGDKAIRAQSIRGRMALDGLYVPIDAPWYEAFVSELLTFPAGKNDDQVDMLGLIGQLLDRMYAPRAETPEEPKKMQDYRPHTETAQPDDWMTY
ncbi:phage terminase large subunit [Sinorhizobium medicae]|uniref:phage terminase large subunit n=1 Tax=Sinorhizobium medicae TaxID=110321 RepID=UPI002AF6B546|nr:phage terminase large subunit [Sinorhizobium medicae]WQO60307.1 phage terminase large subunit [Sinorhizobium medicae]